jgi:holo-[acyl-carrier protein] synthase
MIVGLGMDVIEVARIREVFERHRERFPSRILTDAERAYVLRHADPVERLAGRWAAKEAALKALGTGLADGLRWKDVEILPEASGAPKLILHERALDVARRLKANRFHVTITHSHSVAVAQVILEQA